MIKQQEIPIDVVHLLILVKNWLQLPTTEIEIDTDTSWKLFSKSLRPEHVKDKVSIHGDKQLDETALTMISVMA